MNKISAATPKGMRDFGPIESAQRQYLFDSIRTRFKQFGFQPLETPAMEKWDTLMGKYGNEGDRLIFKVLNSGDFLKNINSSDAHTSATLSPLICEKALRYDLTIPFARFVAQNRNHLALPFRRYQIQPVWRADNPQKGRYREFYQCDADIIGSNSILNETELVLLFATVFKDLKIAQTVIKVNNRKILLGIAQTLSIEDRFVDMTVALDKMDKVGVEGVNAELRNRGFSSQQVAEIIQVFEPSDNDFTKLEVFLQHNELGLQGIDELKRLINLSESAGLHNSKIVFDPTLARGLNYYTGCIFEVLIPNSGLGSVAAGGRYDNLTGVFGLNHISGVGISFGADRIFDYLLSNDLFPPIPGIFPDFLLLNFSEDFAGIYLDIASKLRNKGKTVLIYPDSNVKIGKQLGYANSVNAQYTISIGHDEVLSNTLILKRMSDGFSETLTWDNFIKR